VTSPVENRPLRRQARRARIEPILAALEKQHPEPRLELRFSTPLELLVATILSAQCTDRKVNEVTATLFRKYPDAGAYARVSQEELEADVHATGFFRNKAKSLRDCGRQLLDRYGGEVPPDMKELTTLPGIGRKTANVILGNAFGIASGIAVDTHVQRVARRLRLTRRDDPDGIEKSLKRLVPRNQWIAFTNRLILHGRYICVARKPRCHECLMELACPSSAVA
jgi:endonuclease-3